MKSNSGYLSSHFSGATVFTDLEQMIYLFFWPGFYGFATPGEGVAASQLSTSLP